MVDKLRDQMKTLEDENLQLKSQISQFENTIETQVFQITDLNVKFEESEIKNNELNSELEALREKTEGLLESIKYLQ